MHLSHTGSGLFLKHPVWQGLPANQSPRISHKSRSIDLASRGPAVQDLPAAQRVADRGALALLEASDTRRYAGDVDSLLQALWQGRGSGGGHAVDLGAQQSAVGANYGGGGRGRGAHGNATAAAAMELALGLGEADEDGDGAGDDGSGSWEGDEYVGSPADWVVDPESEIDLESGS